MAGDRETGGKGAGGAVVALVLAAGRGRRVGGNKALLEVGGRPALVRVLEAAAGAGVAQAVVVLGHEAVRVRELLAGGATGGEVVAVDNPEPDRGQTSSIQTGLRGVPEGAAGVLLWPVDVALVSSEDVRAILEAAGAHPGATVVLPSHGGRAGHPVFLRRSLFEAILALDPGAPLHDLVRGERARTRYVERPTDAVLRDLDTPADLEAARRARS